MENWETALKKYGMIEEETAGVASHPFFMHDLTEIVMHPSHYKMETFKARHTVDARTVAACQYDRAQFDSHQGYRAKEAVFRGIEDLVRVNIHEDGQFVHYEAELDVAIQS